MGAIGAWSYRLKHVAHPALGRIGIRPVAQGLETEASDADRRVCDADQSTEVMTAVLSGARIGEHAHRKVGEPKCVIEFAI